MVRRVPPHMAMILVIILFKLPLLAVYGPTDAPDSGDYIVFANAILTGNLDEKLTDGVSPRTYARVIGYPAVIALAKIIAADHWRWAVVAVQFLLSLISSLILYRFIRALGTSAVVAACGGAMHGISLPLVLDQMILSDSLASSLVCIPFLIVGTAIAKRTPIHPLGQFVIGLMIAVSCLVRDANFILLVAPLVVAAICLGVVTGSGFRRTFGIIVLMVLPMILVNLAYRAWNLQRSGAAIVTTAAQTTMLQALASAGSNHPEVFDTSTPFGQVARQNFKEFSFDEVWTINRRLYQDFGMRADQIAAAGFAAYFWAWKNHPVAMLRIPLSNFRFSIMRAPFQPIASIQLLDIWHSNEAPSFRYRGLSTPLAGNLDLLPVMVLEVVSRVVSVIVFLAFAALTPWYFFRHLRIRGMQLRSISARDFPNELAAISLMCTFSIIYAGYAVVHLEPRYITPGIAFVIAVGLANLFRWWTERSA